jgi:hypothetical protein
LVQALSAASEAGQLILTISNNRPIIVADLGTLLTSLSRDYRQISRGRNLVVTNIETNSIHVSITDALIALPYLVAGAKYIKDGIEFTKAVKAIIEFGQSIKHSIEKKRHDPSSGSREGPWRTIEAMVDSAAKNECDLDFRYSGGDGEKLEARLTHADATKIKRAERAHGRKPTSKGIAVADIAAFAEEIEQLRSVKLTAAQPLIIAIVRLLHQTGNEHLVETLAHELERRGHSQWAQQVRSASRHQ